MIAPGLSDTRLAVDSLQVKPVPTIGALDSKLLDSKGRAYGLEPPHSDPILPHLGPGTPGGELLRRYWQPIALASDATDLPKLIRRFGEDLVLFRNRSGEPRQPKNFQFQMASGELGGKKLWKDMTLEEHQRHPLDYEAQSSQGKITFHSQEHLARSDRGVSMHRRLFKKQCQLVAEGGDPVGVAFREEDRRIQIDARSWME